MESLLGLLNGTERDVQSVLLEGQRLSEYEKLTAVLL